MAFLFSSDEYRNRHRALVAAIRASGIRQYVVTVPDNIFYFTGATFEALERPFFMVVGEDGGRKLVVPTLEMDHLNKITGFSEDGIITYREFPAPSGQGWQDVLFGDCLNKGNFGFEDETPYHIAAELVRVGGLSMNLAEEIRVVKSEAEIKLVERAAKYADWGIEQIMRNAYADAPVAVTFLPGQQLLRKIIRETPDWNALATKVICGAWPAPVSAEPHSVPRLNMTLARGPHVAMVLTRVNGYAAESERTFFTVPPTADEYDLFQCMTAARELAFRMIKPGVQCAEIDFAVNRFLDGIGFSSFNNRLHRCGHGFGLGNHEPPWIAEGSKHVLRENMLISIEPGIYQHGIGGYRNSDTVLVTRDGYRSLTTAPTSISALVLPKGGIKQKVRGWVVGKSLGLRPMEKQGL